MLCFDKAADYGLNSAEDERAASDFFALNCQDTPWACRPGNCHRLKLEHGQDIAFESPTDQPALSEN
jgi:hypothetical protein